MRRFLPTILLGAAATAALVLAVAIQPAHRGLAVDAYLVCLGLLALNATIRRVLGSLPGEPSSEIARHLAQSPPAEARLPELEKLEREVTLATQSAFDVHFRLRPSLARVAEARLAARGVALADAEPLLPPGVWDLVRPGRPRPDRHDRSGAELHEIRSAVEALEAI